MPDTVRRPFDTYDLGLIAFAAQADLLVHQDPAAEQRNWLDSFTCQTITALTESSPELRERAYPDWTPEDGDIPDAEDLRAGILERIRDDIICELTAAYEVGEDPFTGAPVVKPSRPNRDRPSRAPEYPGIGNATVPACRTVPLPAEAHPCGDTGDV